jgi:hypothetical protein
MRMCSGSCVSSSQAMKPASEKVSSGRAGGVLTAKQAPAGPAPPRRPGSERRGRSRFILSQTQAAGARLSTLVCIFDRPMRLVLDGGVPAPRPKKLEKPGRVPYHLVRIRDNTKVFCCLCTSARRLTWSSRRSLACWLCLLAVTTLTSRVRHFPPSSHRPRARRCLSMIRTRTRWSPLNPRCPLTPARTVPAAVGPHPRPPLHRLLPR